MTDAGWVALSLTGRIGGRTLRALLEHFGNNIPAILSADEATLRCVPGVGSKLAERIRAIDLLQVQRELSDWAERAVQVTTLSNPDYPASLRAVGDDAPPTLFSRGRWPLPPGKRMAIVGTRQPSQDARALAQNLASELVGRGYTIVSGLAIGIDTAAHMGALIVPDGQTAAVLGCGVLNIYPSDNLKLADLMVERGTVLSELHPGATPSAPNLVARNRIITGLSDGVVVVETEIDGGAMHAARFAAAQGRPIYTFDRDCSGNRRLLEGGAVLLRPDLHDLPF